MNRITKHIPIIIILAIATILRFYNLHQIPYTFDELSTLFRLNFNNFSDLIEFGVKEDGHPAGMHVFMYYYTQLFGMSVGAVKSLFIVFGIISVFLVYKLGNAWFNKTAGLFTASLMAVLQFPVTQSQIARMYGFGILFVLLTVWFWYQYVEKKDKSIPNLLGFILSAAASSYTHYFSLLFVMIVGITGLFLLKGKKRIYYVISGFLIFILFIPHLKIFAYQLHKGGISWLGPFELSALWNYLKYFLNQSYFIAGSIALIVTVFFTKPLIHNRYRNISIIWFVMPILIGGIYALFFSNVMHEKVLYFSFPFILLFISSFIKDVKIRPQLLIVGLLLGVGVFSIVKERRHYSLFYNNRIQIVAEDSYNWIDSSIIDNTRILKFSNKQMDIFFMDNHTSVIDKTIYGDSIKGVKQFIELVDSFNEEYLFLGFSGNINPTYLSIAKFYYPEILKRNYTVAGESWLLKKSNITSNWDCEYWNRISTLDNIKKISGCDSTFTDTTGNLWGYSNQEYIGTAEYALSDITFSRNNIIELSVDVKQLDSIGEAVLVSSIERNGTTYDWRASEFSDFITIDSSKKALLSIRLSDLDYPSNANIKIFIWNKHKSRYLLDNFQITARPGNPFMYGHIDKIPYNTSLYCYP